jgi:thiol-disulfide isomerase/thioredoxin
MNSPVVQKAGSSMMPSFMPKMSLSWPMIIAILISAVIMIGVVYMIYKQQFSTTSYKPNSQNTNASKEAEMILFYVDWCPHCKTAKPEWDQVKAEYQGKTINGYKVIFTEINCTNESAEIENVIKTYKIEGYPTIKLIKDGQIIEYDAKPTKATMEQFLNTVL